MVLAGIATPVYLATAEAFDPSEACSYRPGNDSGSITGPRPRSCATGRVLIVGGGGSAGRLASAEIYTP